MKTDKNVGLDNKNPSEKLEVSGSAYMNYTEYHIQVNSQSNWQLKFSGVNDVIIYIDNAPNFFHRFMQRLAFGFVWEKIHHEDQTTK